MTKKQDSPFTTLCKEREHFETPEWAAKAILNRESFAPGIIIDPCTGTGVLARHLVLAGYEHVMAMDIQDWGAVFEPAVVLQDFLEWYPTQLNAGFSIFMNPPFSKSVEFVNKAFELGARKVLCFCPISFYASLGRNDFWDNSHCSRIWLCAERATCWRHDIPPEKRKNDTPTIYAWYVFERGQGSPNPPIYRLYKKDAEA